MKVNKNAKTRIVPFAVVKAGQECFIEGVLTVKVRSKVAMTTKGDRVHVNDSQQVKMKLKP